MSMFSGVNAGVNWVGAEHMRRPGKKSVCKYVYTRVYPVTESLLL